MTDRTSLDASPKRVDCGKFHTSNCQCAVEYYHLFIIFAVFDVSLICDALMAGFWNEG